MQPKSKALVAAAAGTVAGVAGLAVIALPAGAEAAPKLPDISAEKLVASAMTAKHPAFSGTVAVHNNLGLPNIGSMGSVLDISDAHVFYSGDDRARVSLERGNTEQTFVKGAHQAWKYDSGSNTATRTTLPDVRHQHEHAEHSEAENADPSQAARKIIDTLRKSSDITVDGTARVADRPAYELVLTPKPAEKTLLREVRVAIDDKTRMPLRLEVLANGSADPVVDVGFSQFTVGKQPSSLFDFTPPAGAKVETAKPSDEQKARIGRHAKQAEQVGKSFKTVGTGWDTVFTGKLPAEALAAPKSDDAPDPQGMLKRFGKRVTGKVDGYVVTTRAATILVTDDGRVAAGAVPAQVLEKALAK